MRLRADRLAELPAAVRRPNYDRARQAVGIVHFGIGAFHRAHQAVYTEDAMDAGDRDWAIVGVSLRSASVAQQMNPQQGLYSLSARSGAAIDCRVIGAVKKVLVASEQDDELIALLASADVRVLTFTITEKGYCSAANGLLDFSAANESSVYRYLTAGLARRRMQRLGGLTMLSCDNLSGNGERLRRWLGLYLQRHDPSLAEWVDQHCAFPSSMVDRIVPATTEADHRAATAALGMDDLAHVATEPFSQWVIEDRFVCGRPNWADHGAELVQDVAPYETAKLRMLNGAHSALAYLGLIRGYTFVHEAIADAEIRSIVQRLMCDEAAPGVACAPGQDLGRYASSLLQRFANRALNHRLEQIAVDGSQKIPQRWLDTLIFHSREGRHCESILIALAAWLLHVRGDARRVDDPLAEKMAAAWRQQGDAGVLPALFGPRGLVSTIWTPSQREADTIRENIKKLSQLESLGFSA